MSSHMVWVKVIQKVPKWSVTEYSILQGNIQTSAKGELICMNKKSYNLFGGFGRSKKELDSIWHDLELSL